MLFAVFKMFSISQPNFQFPFSSQNPPKMGVTSKPPPSRTSAPLRQPRLRASCDGCFLAKVKCSKSRPVCSRCLTVGLVCHYSPSSRSPGRAGKRQQVIQPGRNSTALLASTMSEESCAWLAQGVGMGAGCASVVGDNITGLGLRYFGGMVCWPGSLGSTVSWSEVASPEMGPTTASPRLSPEEQILTWAHVGCPKLQAQPCQTTCWQPLSKTNGPFGPSLPTFEEF